MAGFRFSLEPVLRQRQLVEDRCQRELAMVLRQRMILQTQIGQVQRTIRDAKGDLAGDLVGLVDLDRVGRFAHYSGQMTWRVEQIHLRLAALEKQIDQARQNLLHATGARQALDLLRERHRQRWRRDQERREAAELDDLATGQFIRAGALEVNG
jgi:flagellar export protein FliJ